MYQVHSTISYRGLCLCHTAPWSHTIGLPFVLCTRTMYYCGTAEMLKYTSYTRLESSRSSPRSSLVYKHFHRSHVAMPAPTRPWRSRERPRGGIGSGGPYFAANRSRRPRDLPTQYPVPRCSDFREWKICRRSSGTVLYVSLVGTIIYLCTKLVI